MSIPEDDRTIIIAPHTTCDACGNHSGPIFPLTQFRGRSSYHRNNVIPCGAERVSRINDIANAEMELAQLDPEIEQLHNVTYSLEKRRKAVQDFIDQEKCLFAPIRRLPQDVLRYLFKVCQMELEDEGFIDVYKSKTFIRIITGVCSYWRDVALNAPELWCRLKILKTKSSSRRVVDFLGRCISLSGELPLHFLFVQSEEWLGKNCRKIIADCAYRWKDITFEEADVFHDLTFNISPDFVFSSLERLSISNFSESITINSCPKLSDFCVNRTNTDVHITFTSAPMLRNLTMIQVDNPTSTFIDLPWKQITTFHYQSCHFSDGETFTSLLMSMPNLVSFTLSGCDSSTNSNSVVILPSLRTLIFDDYPRSTNENVLDGFTAPCLEQLQVSGPSLPSLMRFLNRSCCPLLELNMLQSLWHLKEIWKDSSSPSLRNVQTLRFPTFMTISDEVELLTRTDANSLSHMVFPRLLFLHWNVDVFRLPNCDINDDISLIPPIINMLTSRITPNAVGEDGQFCYLEAAYISFRWYLSKEERELIREFNRSDVVRKSGFELSVDYTLFDEVYWVILDGVDVDKDVNLY